MLPGTQDWWRGVALALSLAATPLQASIPSCDVTRQPGDCDYFGAGLRYPSTISGLTEEGATAGVATYTASYACQTGNDGRVYLLLDTQASYDAATGDARSTVPGFYFDGPDKTFGGHPHQSQMAALRTSNHRAGCVSGTIEHNIPIVRHGTTAPGYYNAFHYSPASHLASSTGASGNYHLSRIGTGIGHLNVTGNTCNMTVPNITLPNVDLQHLAAVGGRAGSAVADLEFDQCKAAGSVTLNFRNLGTSIDASKGLVANAASGSQSAAGVGLALEIDLYHTNAFVPLDLTTSHLGYLFNKTLTVPLRAHYYRYADTATAGNVTALIEVTATYD